MGAREGKTAGCRSGGNYHPIERKRAAIGFEAIGCGEASGHLDVLNARHTQIFFGVLGDGIGERVLASDDGAPIHAYISRVNAVLPRAPD